MKYFFTSIFMLASGIGWALPMDLSQSNNQFAFDLYHASEEKNLVFSPLSISAALSMTSAGAKEQTLAQMQKVLHLPPNPHPQFKEILSSLKSLKDNELLIANRIWGDASEEGYAPTFQTLLRENYEAELQPLDFHQHLEPSRQTINQWISQQTKEKIPELLKPNDLSPDTDLVLTNAIYFKGTWERKFDPKRTVMEPFFVSNNGKKETSFMKQEASFFYAENQNAQMLGMNYKGQELQFVALLPSAKTPKGSLENLSLEQFNELYKKMSKRQIQVAVPKFKLNSEMEMSTLLEKLGMPLAFDPVKANFQGLREKKSKKNIYLSKVIHEAVIELNETGTEAAAATGVVAVRATAIMPVKPLVLRLDRPFFYAILHPKTGVILFMGTFREP
jgi:serine protease inhibitor